MIWEQVKESNMGIEKTTDELIMASELCLAQHFGCQYCLKVFYCFAFACAVTHRVKQVVTRELKRAMKI